MIEPVNLAEKFARIDTYWSPRIAGKLNGNVIKLAKIKGEFVWHHHAHEDEMFLVVQGQMVMRLREGGQVHERVVRAGEFIIVPRGVEHCPTAEDECQIMLFEPQGTLNTGNVRNERTITDEQSI